MGVGTLQKMGSKLQSPHFRLESVVNDKMSSKTKLFPQIYNHSSKP